jgi:hypothetical protein
VRAVWTGERWELHFVCKMRVETPETPGEKTAGVDLGICNTAAVSVGDETLLYPGNALNAAENMRATVTPNPARDIQSDVTLYSATTVHRLCHAANNGISDGMA